MVRACCWYCNSMEVDENFIFVYCQTARGLKRPPWTLPRVCILHEPSNLETLWILIFVLFSNLSKLLNLQVFSFQCRLGRSQMMDQCVSSMISCCCRVDVMWLASSSARLSGGGRLAITTKDREGYRVSDVTVMPWNHFIVLLFCYLELQVIFYCVPFLMVIQKIVTGWK